MHLAWCFQRMQVIDEITGMVTATKTAIAAMDHTEDTATAHTTAITDQGEAIDTMAILHSIDEGGIVTDHTIEEIS